MSGGEQQMLALARALMSAPRILLIDEPSVGLAPLLVARTIDKIKELKEGYQLTVLMAEQNFTQAIRIADRGYVIVHGRIEFSGNSAAELNDNELIRQFYLVIRLSEATNVGCAHDRGLHALPTGCVLAGRVVVAEDRHRILRAQVGFDPHRRAKRTEQRTVCYQQHGRRLRHGAVGRRHRAPTQRGERLGTLRCKLAADPIGEPTAHRVAFLHAEPHFAQIGIESHRQSQRFADELRGDTRARQR